VHSKASKCPDTLNEVESSDCHCLGLKWMWSWAQVIPWNWMLYHKCQKYASYSWH